MTGNPSSACSCRPFDPLNDAGATLRRDRQAPERDAFKLGQLGLHCVCDGLEPRLATRPAAGRVELALKGLEILASLLFPRLEILCRTQLQPGRHRLASGATVPRVASRL